MSDKRFSGWSSRYYTDEQIIRPSGLLPEEVPEQLRAMRDLAAGVQGRFLPRDQLFLKQARMMEEYEDDFPFDKPVKQYFPTYQSFNNRELRGYFSWRTRARKDEFQKTSLSFVYLHIYELLNQVGCKDPLDGYSKLKQLREAYAPMDEGLDKFLSQWLWDYVIYYDLDPELLSSDPRVCWDKQLMIIMDNGSHSDVELLMTLGALSSYKIERSSFCKEHTTDIIEVTSRVWSRLELFYSENRQQSFMESLFGVMSERIVTFFNSAVFCRQSRRRDFTYEVDPLRKYRCEDHICRMSFYPESGQEYKIGQILRTIDSALREATGYKKPIKPGVVTKWMYELISSVCRCYVKEQAEQPPKSQPISIDLSALDKIRTDSESTKEKLIVDEEELWEEEEPITEEAEEAPAEDEGPLDGNEYRLMQCLLYGGDLSWVHEAGLMMSMLADSINEKLFDMFGDTVLEIDDIPVVIEDYAEELKEVVRKP